MHVLVIGGVGFIGGHIAEQLAAKGHDITIIDSFVPYYDLGIKERNVEAACTAATESGGGYELVEASITDEETVNELFADTDVVYHQAAQASVRQSIEQSKKVNHNVDSTINILETAHNNDIERVVWYQRTSRRLQHVVILAPMALFFALTVINRVSTIFPGTANTPDRVLVFVLPLAVVVCAAG